MDKPNNPTCSCKFWTLPSITRLVGGLGLVLLLALVGCAPTLYINETYSKSLEVPVVDGNIALDNGIQIEVRAILAKEKVKPEKMVVTRLQGGYLLVANGFRNVWMLRPAGGAKASYTPLAVSSSSPLSGVRLLHSASNACVKLATGDGAGAQWFIHASGELAKQCKDKGAE
ncbi:MAG: hypothetical protein EP343_33400 [Deltaproteobacteria bacterium]|nr:MAG: hypothetical protein EP343_33400 [Deltaproteobacteria bacterium]